VPTGIVDDLETIGIDHHAGKQRTRAFARSFPDHVTG
jgi:hypothetical protein